MLATWTVLASLALIPAPDAPQVVIAAGPPVDAERLADALRVYLDEYGIRVEARSSAGGPELRQRLDEARQLGQAVRAVAVVRIAHASAGAVEIELVDLATDKALLVSVPRTPRDEDLYRALALKIQALLRTTLSEARAELDPRSSLGRLVAADAGAGPPASPPQGEARLALQVGYDVLAFPGGASFTGLGARGSWRPSPRVQLALSTAALGTEKASLGTVEAAAAVVPLHVALHVPVPMGAGEGRVAVWVGPSVEVAHVRVTATSSNTPVRSTRNILVAGGVEAEGRLTLVRGLWLFARGAALGVLNGERYNVAGTPLFDTSRLQLAAAFGAGVGLP